MPVSADEWKIGCLPRQGRERRAGRDTADRDAATGWGGTISIDQALRQRVGRVRPAAAAAGLPVVGLCGCGRWGRNLARAFARMGALAAVCDIDPGAACMAEQAHAVPSLDFAPLLASGRVEAVAIATPSATHYALARAALRAGKHVFVEKPLALELDHARELAQLAAATGRVLMVGHICLYHPAFRLLERLVAAGAIGRVTRIHATRLKMANGQPADDVLSNLATHDVAMVLALLGAAPLRVTSGDAVGAAGQRERVAAIRIEFDGGRTADIFAAQDHSRAERRFTVLGERGALTFDDLAEWQSKLVLARDAGRVACPIEPSDALEAECAEFLACIGSGGRPRSAGDAAVAVVRTLERARRARAGRNGREVPLLALDPW